MNINKYTRVITRAPQSDDFRSLLIALAACDVERPLPRVNVDWDQMLLALQEHRIGGFAAYNLSHRNDDVFPPPAFQQAVKKLHYLKIVRMAKIYRYFRLVVNKFQNANIDFLVLKGPAMAHMAVPEPDSRYFVDLDLMIWERDWAAMNSVLNEIGFFAVDGSSTPPPKVMLQVVPSHQTIYAHPETKFTVEIHHEDLLHDNLVVRDLEGFWSRAGTLSIDGTRFTTLSLEDHILHVCGHAHRHGFTHLCLLTDLLFILRDHASQINWDSFLRTVALEEAQVPVYYSFRLVSHLFDLSLPADVMDAVRPDAFRRWWHERYMPEKLVNSLLAKSWNAFSSKNSPLFKSAILNILVMGRRPEKLRYLLHLIIPPPEWMRHKYNIPATRSLVPYYLFRPFFLIFRSLGEVIISIIKKFQTSIMLIILPV